MYDVLLCIENRIYREGLKSILQASERVAAVHLCAEPREISHALAGARCDLVLVDVSSIGAAANPVELVAATSRAARGLPVVALGLSEGEDEVLDFIEAGAAAFVTREGSIDDLMATIGTAARGELHCPPRLARLMQERLTGLATGKARPTVLERLSQREHHILGLLRQRLSNKQIARMLGLEVSTIKNHVHNIIVKLSVKNRGEAAALLGFGAPAATGAMGEPLRAAR